MAYYLNGKSYSSAKARNNAMRSSSSRSSSSSSGSRKLSIDSPIVTRVSSTSKFSNPSRSSGSSSRTSSSRTSSSGTGSSGQRMYSDGYGGYTTMNPNSSSYAKTYGGSSSSRSSGSSSGSSGSSYANSSRNYHQEAQDAAARGDWSAVSRALAARQAKIDAQGGNDRGTSNAQILSGLRSQYSGSYNALPSSTQNTLNMAATGKLNGRGWESGKDYLADAISYAQAGDLDAAYDALAKRGYKMADTGSSGGGTSQDQAYAMVQRLFDQGTGGAAEYRRQLADNARALAEHPTQFGTGADPNLAGKHFRSADGKYIIYYDSKGTPTRALPYSASAYTNKYSPEQLDLVSRYYGGTEDYADIRRQLHNMDVARTGNGRLIDQNWNWASGEAAPVESWYDYWSHQPDLSGRNAGQDTALLEQLRQQINAGETFSSPAQVPIVRRTEYPLQDDINGGGRVRGSRTSRASGSGGEGYYGDGNGLYDVEVDPYQGEDLTQYLEELYRQNLAAQTAQLQASFEQNRAEIEAENRRIAQAYLDQQNQAAAQNDLQRMYMAELGNYQGLNTGATGQLAMARGMAYLDNLATLGAAREQDLSANGLALNQLSSAYRGDVDAAAAQSGAALAEALYDERVRQYEAAVQAAERARAQANWERQFAYGQQQDALAQANWERQYNDELSYRQQQYRDELAAAQAQAEAAGLKTTASNAWDMAQMMLKNGVVPDQATLEAAGVNPTDARNLAAEVRSQMAAKAAKSTKSSGGSSRSSGGSGKPKLTYPQALAAIEDGRVTPSVISAYDYYMGNGTYEQDFGGGTDAGGDTDAGGAGMNPSYFSAMGRSLAAALQQGNTKTVAGSLDGVWGELSSDQRRQVLELLDRYGVKYSA